ncbi:MAG TPA: hypothetical protein VF454_06870, partial [Gemmatimonadales bacterium]
NYCWYLESCDSRTPDTHRGDHAAYRTAILDSTHHVVWAKFDEADRWTYAPWSDPTAWEAGVRTMTKGPAEAGLVMPYWGRQLQRTLFLWLLPVLLAVAIPWVLLEWSAGMWRLWRPEFRPVAATAVLGIAGVLQFVLVHAEPRLIAPSAFLCVLALLAHTSPEATVPDRRLLRRLVTIVGVLTVASYAFTKLRDGYQAEHRLERTLQMLATRKASYVAAGISQDRIVILGPGIPVMAAAYLSRAHVVAQVPPASLDALLDQSPQRQRHTFFTLFAGLAQVAWLTTPDGGVTLVAIPTADSTTTTGPTR